MKHIWIGWLILFSLSFSGISAQEWKVTSKVDKDRWVDSVYNALSVEQRIGQLLMIRANSSDDSATIRRISGWIRQYDIGGICFFKGGPVRQAALTNYYQSLAATPILISMDAEWGLGMRLDSTLSFARQMTLGAIRDESLVVQYGAEIARQLRRLGVHVSFSPVADINNNPHNPVINIRSFGENKEEVAERAILYMKGLQQGGVISVAKHFPGHGDTDTDSHLALPVIQHNKEMIDSLEIYPFRKLIAAGIDGIMVAHLFVPALDTARNLPSSLSPVIISGLLRNELGFKGVIFSDALDMKGASNFTTPGKVELAALAAGNDVLLLPTSVDSAVSVIKAAIDSGWVNASLLEDRCRRVLAMKYNCGLNKIEKVKTENLLEDLNSPSANFLNKQLYEQAITLLKNEDQLVPLVRPDTLKIAAVTLGYKGRTLFQDRVSSYLKIDEYTLPREPSRDQMNEVFRISGNYNLLLVTLNNTHPSPQKDFGISPAALKFADSLIALKPSVLSLFAVPYAEALFKNTGKARAVLIAYQDNPFAYDAAAQVLTGGIAARGTTPVSVNGRFPLKTGKETQAMKLKYTVPEEVGIRQEWLSQVDSLAMEGIREKAYPGCQVLIAQKGRIIYSKTFGYHDYSRREPVLPSDLYDLASVTKVAATTLAIMKLHDLKKIDFHRPLSRYLDRMSGTNKSRTSVREIMAHQAGFVPWIPFYQKTLKNGFPDTLVYSVAPKPGFSTKVAGNMFIRNDYPGIMVDSILKSPVSSKKVYNYSDLGFILLAKAVEEQTNLPFDRFVDSVFYKPMGLPTFGFNPLEYFSPERIVPTENDTVFRHQLIQGYVHDPAAAMMGGVAGHAGLFGNAADLAALFQMLLQHGTYGGRRYLDSVTVEEFTSAQFSGNRRGLGFDKPQAPGEEGPACSSASMSSFGHSGFTGTYVWADPAEELILVFLSNRVNPDASINKLVKLGTRTKIQQVVYDAIGKARSENLH